MWNFIGTTVFDQCVHCVVANKVLHYTMEISFIYGYNTIGQRKTLWNDLREIGNNRRNPWVLLGDFNTIFQQDHRVNGAPVTYYEIQDGCLFVENFNLTHLKYVGPYLTWSGKQNQDSRIRSKIDHIFVDVAWIARFPESLASFIQPGISDHSPIVVRIQEISKGGGDCLNFLIISPLTQIFCRL